MYVKKIELNNFRNYTHCEVDFPCIKTLIIGKNAQGKTNLLESIHYIALLSPTRSNTDSEVIKMGEDFARIKAEIVKNEIDTTLEVTINPPKKKILKVDGVKKTSHKEFLGYLKVVNFSVNDLLLLRGAPDDRRKWLDDAIGQLYIGYKDRLLKYNKIRTQRNNLLKSFGGNISLSERQIDLLSVFDEQIIITGSNLIFLRQKFLKEIQKLAKQKHKDISGFEDFYMVYNSTITGDFDCRNGEITTIEAIAEKYKNLLAEKRNEEVIRAKTVVGPHRDDITFFINEVNSKSYASQGQQRTIVLALKLAELDFLTEKTREFPLLLLDDVLAELDQNRQNYLLNSINKEVQTIITSVDTINFPEEYLQDVKIYTIKDGEIV